MTRRKKNVPIHPVFGTDGVPDSIYKIKGRHVLNGVSRATLHIIVMFVIVVVLAFFFLCILPLVPANA